jgi:hypothetical protein
MVVKSRAVWKPVMRRSSGKIRLNSGKIVGTADEQQI